MGTLKVTTPTPATPSSFTLKKWDTVKVKARSGSDVRLYGNYDEFYTTFCGALLAPSIHGVGSSTSV